MSHVLEEIASQPATRCRAAEAARAEGGRLRVWAFSPAAVGLPAAVRVTGTTFLQARRDPMVELVTAQRVAVALAESKGLDPDPLHLSRSVILPPGGRKRATRRRGRTA
jgi:hypothetical protein